VLQRLPANLFDASPVHRDGERALGQRHGRVSVVESEPRALATPRPLQRAGVRHGALQEGDKAVAALGEGAVAKQVGEPDEEAMLQRSFVDERLPRRNERSRPRSRCEIGTLPQP
jgi:hypothetical protein